MRQGPGPERTKGAFDGAPFVFCLNWNAETASSTPGDQSGGPLGVSRVGLR
jgi:hypothetical protein